MSTKTINILALILGFLGIVVFCIGILVGYWILKRTDKLIKSLDEKAEAIMKERQKDERPGNEGGREKGHTEDD